MMKHVAFKLAASTMVLGLTTVGCKPMSTSHRPATASSQAGNLEKRAADLFYGKASQSAAAGDYASALAYMERAVALAPQDEARRVALADLYLRNGRFTSAEESYGDALTLRPDNSRAAMSRVLAQIAMGNSGAALAALDALAATSPAADVGLAYALAGQRQRAISMLEPAARTEGADARVRQNLALSYALAGDWQKARVTALQDVSPADIDARMEQWAAFTSPQTSYDQVASLLGVTPVQDAGRPSQLALAPTIAEPVALAAVEAPVPVVETPVAEVQPVVEPEEVQVQYAAAAEQLVTPQPAVLSVAPQPAEAPLPAFEPRKKKPRVAGQPPKRSIASASGRFVVQIGAYANANQVEKAWSQAQRRYRFDDSSQPLSTTVTIPGRGMFHRLSIAGFDDRGDASQLCASIRARGGACFVRATAGDAPVRWASRNSRRA